MAEKVEVDIEVNSNLEPTIANLKTLKKQLKETAAGSAEFNKISQQIRDMDDAIKDASATSDDFAGYLENASGPLGVLGKGLRSAEKNFSSFNAVLKTSVIGILVAAIGGLVAAFSQSETAMKKLQPLMIAFEKILGGIFKAFEPVLDAFIELATSALPYITKGIGMFYSGLFSLFSLVKNVGLSVGQILKGVFTLDFDALKEGAASIKDAFTSVGKTFDETYKRFEEGTKEQTKTEKENEEERLKNAEEARKKREEAAKKAEEARKKAFDDKLKMMEAEDKLDEARLKKQKEEALVLAQTEQEKLDVEKKYAELAYQLRLKDLNDKMALYDKDSLEYKALQTEKVNEESNYLSQLRGFTETQKKINDDAAKTKEEQEKKAAEISRGIALTELQAKFEDLDKENARIEGDFLQDLERLGQKREILNQQEAIELSNTELNEFQKTEIRKKFADARKNLSDQEIATEKAAQAARVELQNAYVDLAGQFGQTLQAIAGKNKGVAIAGIVIEQAANIAKIISNTAVANAKSVAAFPITGGMPWVAINTASAALSIASSIAAAKKSISQIQSTDASSSTGGGSVSSSTPPPAYGGAPAPMAAPQVQTTQGLNPSSQIGQTLMAAQQRPVRAYVISGEVSSQQALDRRTNVAATFSGG